jgi:uncharacterized protein
MNDDEFEWDDAKAAANYDKHHVSFDHARHAFYDVFAVDGHDDRENYGEDRYTISGMVDGVLLFVAYTQRGERVRIITARRATRGEQNDYYQQNAQWP